AGELLHLPLGGLRRGGQLLALPPQPLLLGGVRGVGLRRVHQQPRLPRPPVPQRRRHLVAGPVAPVERRQQRRRLPLPRREPLGGLGRLGALAVLLGAGPALGLQLPVQPGQRRDRAEDPLRADLVERLRQQVRGDLRPHRRRQERHAPHPPPV